MTNKDYVDSLRMIADWFETHPEIPLPTGAEDFNYFNARTKDDMAKLVAAIGSCQKVYGEAFPDSFEVTHLFGSIRFRAIAYRENICERIKVGTRSVPEHTVPARPAQLIPAHDEDVYEWDCSDGLLQKAQAEQAAVEQP